MSEVTQPPSFRIADGDAGGDAGGDVTHLLQVLDQLAGSPGVVRLRAWAREAVAARPGERAVDVGSGAGEEVLALADEVGPDGEAIGVEPIPGLRAEATRRAAGSTARFVAGEAYGGRVALLDSDWATTIVHPGDPETLQSLQQFWLGRSANPFSGRRLAGQLAAAGLVVVDQGSQALIEDATGIEEFLAMMGTFAIEAGVVTEAQWANLRADLAAGAARGDFHFSVTMFGVLARKP